jgi:hypothetical protein
MFLLVSPSGWMTGRNLKLIALMIRSLPKYRNGDRIIFIIDCAPSHVSKRDGFKLWADDTLNFEVWFVPAGATGLCQVEDTDVFAPFKALLGGSFYAEIDKQVMQKYPEPDLHAIPRAEYWGLVPKIWRVDLSDSVFESAVTSYERDDALVPQSAMVPPAPRA